jgi:hypothetical protein
LVRYAITVVLVTLSVAGVIIHGSHAARWNEQLAVDPPLAYVLPRIDDPQTPRLTRRVVLVVIDGLGADESKLPFLDELRARGVATTSRVPYPTVSRPNYVTLLTGVPPRDSGIRANRVLAPTPVDTVMDRVQAAGMRVETASDYGSFSSLFVRFPFHAARRTESLDELALVLDELIASDAAFVPILVLDVDRAGHARGVGEAYREAAASVDRMLRAALAKLDLSRDTAIITADHGHVAVGGHGGDEPEVSHVPLVMAGAGIVPGAAARDARSIDVAPTVAALLGVPAPGHAEGRALVELLALEPAAAARRAAADDARATAMTAIAASAESEPDWPRLAIVIAVALLAVVLGLTLLPGAVAFAGVRTLAGALAFALIPIAMLVVTRGHLSPSYIPSLDRVQKLGGIAVIGSLVAQVVASWLVIRRSADRLASANGLALIGIAIAIGTIDSTNAYFARPFYDVPSPLWMVAIPTLEIAAATVCAATVVTLAMAAIATARRRPASPRASDAG